MKSQQKLNATDLKPDLNEADMTPLDQDSNRTTLFNIAMDMLTHATDKELFESLSQEQPQSDNQTLSSLIEQFYSDMNEHINAINVRYNDNDEDSHEETGNE